MQEQIKKKLLKSALKIIPLEGWGSNLLVKAERAANLPDGIASVLFPSGINDFFEYYIEEIDREMLSIYKDSISLRRLDVHQQIRQCIISRIEVLVRNKDAAAQTLAFLAMPINCVLSLRTLWRTVDLIWYEAGCDQSTDFNYYTKRVLLAGVYSSAMLYWINDKSENFTETIGFLDRRLEDIHKIYKVKKKFAGIY